MYIYTYIYNVTCVMNEIVSGDICVYVPGREEIEALRAEHGGHVCDDVTYVCDDVTYVCPWKRRD